MLSPVSIRMNGYSGQHNQPQGNTMKVSLRREYLNQGGYTYGRFGKYFGTGLPLYRYTSEDGEIDAHIRASSRAEAKKQVQLIAKGYGLTVSFYC
jgi:hypothetical protein